MLGVKLASLRDKLGRKAKSEPKYAFYSLYEHICEREVLEMALYFVLENNGKPGVDGVTCYSIRNCPIAKQTLLDEIEKELRGKRYKPQPVRRVLIPKPDGRKRPLGIPTVKDRVVQTAVKLIIEPIVEADFLDCSYGFRPRKSAHQAAKQIVTHLRQGCKEIYDADIKQCFDMIPHNKLMKAARKRIADGSVLRLLYMWLRTAVAEKVGNKVVLRRSKRGTPQGGVISPLLANLFLHWFDKLFQQRYGPSGRGIVLIRYADDFLILAKTLTQADINFVIREFEERFELEINKEKTRFVDMKKRGEKFRFLGFDFKMWPSKYPGGKPFPAIEPSDKAVKRSFERIKELTSHELNYMPIDVMVTKLNQYLEGWGNYFSLGYPSRVFEKINYFVDYKLIKQLARRSQKKYRKKDHETWYRQLRNLGLRRLTKKRFMSKV
jgi:RNA-directed DNA polymerase